MRNFRGMGKRGVDLGAEERDNLPAPACNAIAPDTGAYAPAPHDLSTADACARADRRFRYFADGPIEDLGPVAKIPDTTSDTRDTIEVGDEVRALAERGVAQARQAFDGFIGTARRAVDAFSGQAQSAGKGAKAIAEQVMIFTEKDMAISFEFADRFARARDVQEVLRLQAEYVRAQMRLFSEPLIGQEK
jgi:phasin